MNYIQEKTVFRKGEVYKVFCWKSGAMTLLINCQGCERNKGYDGKTLKCEQVR
jgi:hypothetical protein